MNTTARGIIIVLVVGLVALGIAALIDRHTRRALEGSTSEGGEADAAAPTYKTITDVRRATPARPALDVATQIRLRTSKIIDLRLASPDLATHAGNHSVATNPRVLICNDAVTTVREMVPIWQMVPQEQTITVVAPGFDPAVIDVFAANLAIGTRLVQAVVGEAPARAAMADATGAIPQPRSELQAGGVPITALGQASLIVADGTQTQVCGVVTQ